MRLLRNFLNNKEGSLAIQFAIVILPLLALIGASVDYSRISVVKSSLQSTLDNNILSMPATAFGNRLQMEEHIVSLAGVNLDSDTIKADISIKKDKIHIELSDKVKTPMLSLYGQPEIEVMVSIDIDQQDAPSSTRKNTRTAAFQNNENIRQPSRSEVNNLKRLVSKRITNIQASKYLSQERKLRILQHLRKQLQELKSL